ncbi:MAG: hypothetical protein ACRD0Y_02035, partial [Terriglobales bacterium]
MIRALPAEVLTHARSATRGQWRTRLLSGALLVCLLVASALILSPNAAADPTCTITYTGAYQPDPLAWEEAGNWSPVREPGPSDYACIPAGFTGGVVDVGDGSKVEGVSVLDGAGLRLHNFGLELTDPATPSVINSVNVSSLATFTIDQGIT